MSRVDQATLVFLALEAFWLLVALFAFLVTPPRMQITSIPAVGDVYCTICGTVLGVLDSKCEHCRRVGGAS